MNVIQTLEKIIDNSYESRKLFQKHNLSAEPFSDEDINKKFLSTKSINALNKYEESISLYSLLKDYESIYKPEHNTSETRVKILEIDKKAFEKSLDVNDDPNKYLSIKQRNVLIELGITPEIKQEFQENHMKELKKLKI